MSGASDAFSTQAEFPRLSLFRVGFATCGATIPITIGDHHQKFGWFDAGVWSVLRFLIAIILKFFRVGRVAGRGGQLVRDDDDLPDKDDVSGSVANAIGVVVRHVPDGGICRR